MPPSRKKKSALSTPNKISRFQKLACQLFGKPVKIPDRKESLNCNYVYNGPFVEIGDGRRVSQPRRNWDLEGMGMATGKKTGRCLICYSSLVQDEIVLEGEKGRTEKSANLLDVFEILAVSEDYEILKLVKEFQKTGTNWFCKVCDAACKQLLYKTRVFLQLQMQITELRLKIIAAVKLSMELAAQKESASAGKPSRIKSVDTMRKLMLFKKPDLDAPAPQPQPNSNSEPVTESRRTEGDREEGQVLNDETDPNNFSVTEQQLVKIEEEISLAFDDTQDDNFDLLEGDTNNESSDINLHSNQFSSRSTFPTTFGEEGSPTASRLLSAPEDTYLPQQQEEVAILGTPPVTVVSKRKRRTKPDGNKIHICTHCGKQLSSEKVLKIHERQHTGERPYPCQHCSERFAQKNGLDYHLFKKHPEIEQKKYQCEICGVHLSGGQSAYSLHKRVIHLGIKKHECQQCGKRFGQRIQMEAHARRHTEDRCFSCPVCSYSFSSAQTLEKHLKRRHKHTTSDNPIITSTASVNTIGHWIGAPNETTANYSKIQ